MRQGDAFKSLIIITDQSKEHMKRGKKRENGKVYLNEGLPHLIT